MAKKTPKFQYLLCIQNDAYPASLEVRKVYRVLPDDSAAGLSMVRIVDESGEDYLYPEDYFVPIDVPLAATRVFGQAS